MRSTTVLAGAAALLIVTTLGVVAQSPPIAGDPLPGITPTEFQEFRLGLEDFREVEEASDGLDPLFNGTGLPLFHNVPCICRHRPSTARTARSG